MRLVGDAQAQLRLLSVLPNVASIDPLFFLARRSLGARFGTYATVLFAFSPMVLVYSLEARSYMLFLFLLLCLLLVHWMVVIEANTSKSVPPLILALARVLQYWIAQARWRTAGAVIATAILSVYMAGFFRQAVRPHGQSWRNVVHIVQQSYQPGDEVVF